MASDFKIAGRKITEAESKVFGKLSSLPHAKLLFDDNDIANAAEANALLNLNNDKKINSADLNLINETLPEESKLTKDEFAVLDAAFVKHFPSKKSGLTQSLTLFGNKRRNESKLLDTSLIFNSNYLGGDEAAESVFVAKTSSDADLTNLLDILDYSRTLQKEFDRRFLALVEKSRQFFSGAFVFAYSSEPQCRISDCGMDITVISRAGIEYTFRNNNEIFSIGNTERNTYSGNIYLIKDSDLYIIPPAVVLYFSKRLFEFGDIVNYVPREFDRSDFWMFTLEDYKKILTKAEHSTVNSE